MSDPSNNLDRRKLLGGIASAGVALGLGAAAASSANAQGMPHGEAPEGLLELARLRSYKARRSSSWDRKGGNADSVPVEKGATSMVLDVQGAGVVTHVWFTINSDDPHHLKNLVLRMYWDGEASPSVEAPIGDFFGLTLGEYFTYQSALTTVAPLKALNCYFTMPFANGAKITVTNEGSSRTNNLYYAVDYVTLASLPEDMGRFHAQYRQASPAKGWTRNWKTNGDPGVGDKPNLNGEGNYIFLEAAGRGHFIGVTHGVLQNQADWFGEGDDMIFVDGDSQPTINGTGTEDYYNGAWGFGPDPFAYLHNGAPFIADPDRIGGRFCLYRWHIESPITFEKSIRVTMEHGHANHRSDKFFTVAYWYQTEPHQQFPSLPKSQDRIPRLFEMGGPGAQKPAE